MKAVPASHQRHSPSITGWHRRVLSPTLPSPSLASHYPSPSKRGKIAKSPPFRASTGVKNDPLLGGAGREGRVEGTESEGWRDRKREMGRKGGGQQGRR